MGLVSANSQNVGLLIVASDENFQLLEKRKEMLPFVIQSDHIHLTTLLIANVDTGCVETIVGLNPKQPFLPFSSGHITEEVDAFIVRPNIEYVDVLSEPVVSMQSLQKCTIMCSPVHDFESILIHIDEDRTDRFRTPMDLNSAVIKNRQTPEFIKCIYSLTAESTSVVFNSMLKSASSRSGMLSFTKEMLENTFKDANDLIYNQPKTLIDSTTMAVDDHWWTPEELRENEHDQCFARVCVKQGHILEISKGMVDLWGVPFEGRQVGKNLAPYITPADFAPSHQLDGKKTTDKMLHVIRHALVEGHSRVNFMHFNAQRQTILCDWWIRRIGNFEDLNVIGHIKRAVALTPSQKI